MVYGESFGIEIEFGGDFGGDFDMGNDMNFREIFGQFLKIPARENPVKSRGCGVFNTPHIYLILIVIINEICANI